MDNTTFSPSPKLFIIIYREYTTLMITVLLTSKYFNRFMAHVRKQT